LRKMLVPEEVAVNFETRQFKAYVLLLGKLNMWNINVAEGPVGLLAF